VSERALNFAELTELLERIRPERAGGKTIDETTQAQVQHLLARIAALTDALRTGESDHSTRLGSRLLLDDLAMVAALFRARSNDLGTSLTCALDNMRTVLGRGEGLLESAREPRQQ
jgi:ribosomal protein S15P/S13E